MPRPPRIEVPGGVYHVDTVAVHAASLFLDDKDRRQWIRLLAAVVSSFRWTCCSYCLVTNHYHLVVRIETTNLASGMQYLNSRHAQLFNQRYARRGHLFGARYHAELLKRDSHALEVCRYVPLNAVKAGLSRMAEDWPWSSYAATIGFAPEPAFLDSSWVLGHFAADRSVAQRRYQAFVEGGVRG
jgi:REP element-mobilizing transposase RayT